MKAKRDKIREVNSKKALDVINCRTPLGLFIHRDGDIWVGIDNTTREAWTEEFKTRELCVSWLVGEIEMSDILEEGLNQ